MFINLETFGKHSGGKNTFVNSHTLAECSDPKEQKLGKKMPTALKLDILPLTNISKLFLSYNIVYNTFKYDARKQNTPFLMDAVGALPFTESMQSSPSCWVLAAKDSHLPFSSTSLQTPQRPMTN